jgi:hypothetical protein
MKVLLIPTNIDAQVEIETIDDNDMLGAIQSMVGGYVEDIKVRLGSPFAININDRIFVAANEDGRRLNLPYNDRASALVGVELLGNVVITGDTTDTWVDVPEDVVSLARLA